MDYLDGDSTVAVGAPAVPGNILEGIIGIIVAMAVLRLEITRHAADLPQWTRGRKGYVQSARIILRQHVPEVAGLAACLVLAVTLRVRGGKDNTVDEKTWAEIARQWPMLLTADSLLSLQAMLRLVVFLSSALRGAASLPLSREAALFLCSAALARVALTVRSSAYRLDGPLGGFLPAVCELASVPILAALCQGIPRSALMASMTTIVAAAWVARRNHLSLADDLLTDSLFMFAHIAELLAAFAYLMRALLLGVSRAGVAARFGHIMMPLQQVLAAYYFVQAFDAVPQLVGSGHPFELLQVGGVMQLGAYAGAAVLHLAECLEMPVQGDVDHLTQEEGEEEGEEVTSAPLPGNYSFTAVANEEAWPSSENAVPRAAAVRAVRAAF